MARFGWRRIRNSIGTRLLSAHGRLWDRRLGIATRDDTDVSRPETARAKPNMALNYRALAAIERRIALQPTDMLFDLGCGHGRVLCYFARRGIARCVGIELRPDVAAAARTNAARARGRQCPIEVREGDAAGQDYDGATVLFLYNPFDAEVLEHVLRRVQQQRDGRPVRLVYVNPLEEAVLEATPWLERSDSFRVPYRGYDMGTSIWRSIDEASLARSGRLSGHPIAAAAHPIA